MENIKLVQVGDGAVGKTCLLITYANGSFPEDYIPTVFDNYNANINVDGRTVSLGLWDISSSADGYDRLRPLSYPETNVFLLSFSLADPTSLENVRDRWYPEIRQHCPDVPVILVGLKSDLRNDDLDAGLRVLLEETVTHEAGQAMADELFANAYVEVSSKEGINVNEVMEIAVRAAWRGARTAETVAADEQAAAAAAQLKMRVKAQFGSARDSLVRGAMAQCGSPEYGVDVLVIPSRRRVHEKRPTKGVGVMLVVSVSDGSDAAVAGRRRKSAGVGVVGIFGDLGDLSNDDEMWKGFHCGVRKVVKRLGGEGVLGSSSGGAQDIVSVVTVVGGAGVGGEEEEEEEEEEGEERHEVVDASSVCDFVVEGETVGWGKAKRQLVAKIQRKVKEARRKKRSGRGAAVRISDFAQAVRKIVSSFEEDDKVPPTSIRRVIVVGSAAFSPPSESETELIEDLLLECEAKKVSVSMIGIGNAYDEELFSKTARRTSGCFYHAIRPSDVGSKMSKEMHGIVSMLRAHSCELSVFPLNGLEILDVHPAFARRSDLTLRRRNGRSAAGSFRLSLGCLHSSDTLKFLLNCRLRPKASDDAFLGDARVRSRAAAASASGAGGEDSTTTKEFLEVGLRFVPFDSAESVSLGGVLSLGTTTDASVLRHSTQMKEVFNSAKAISKYPNEFRVVARKIASRAVFWKRKVHALKASFNHHIGKDPTGHLEQIIRSYFELETLLPLVSSQTCGSIGRAFFGAGFDVESSSDFGLLPGQDSDAELWDDLSSLDSEDLEEGGGEQEEESNSLTDEEEGEELGEVDLDDFDEDEGEIDDEEDSMEDYDFDEGDDGDDGGVLVIDEGDTLTDDDDDDMLLLNEDEEEGEVVDLVHLPPPSSVQMDDRFAGLLSPTSPSRPNFEVVRPDELIHEQQRKIVAVADAIHSTVGVAGALLKHFQWNQSALCAAYLENRERVCEEARVTLAVTPFVTGTEPEMECFVCFGDFAGSEMFALACGHYFCRDCWERHLHVKIADGPTCLATLCPYRGCGKIVDEELFREICSEEDMALFQRYLLRSLVDDNPRIIWCPAPDCGRAVFCPEGAVENVVCLCGEQFCFKCQKEAHQPSTCDEVERWEELSALQSSTGEWLQLNTKKCPRCWKRIEKNGGCNHMTVRGVSEVFDDVLFFSQCGSCKFEFCWMCLGPWLLHGDLTGGYYKCVWVSEEAEKRKLERRRAAFERRQNQRLKQIQQQFAAQNLSQQFERNLKVRVTALESELENVPGGGGFLHPAATQLIHCRRALKYSFVKSYYMGKGRERELFDHLQGGLFAQTERLSELLENAPLSPTEWDREAVISCTRAAKLRLQNLLQGMTEI